MQTLPWLLAELAVRPGLRWALAAALGLDLWLAAIRLAARVICARGDSGTEAAR